MLLKEREKYGVVIQVSALVFFEVQGGGSV